jgi:tRNA-modifying protein YgfZ
MKTGVLREIHRAEARALMAYHDWEVPALYSSVDQEFQAATDGAALLDHSLFGRIEINGADGLDLLHRLSTNDILSMRPGQVIPTVLTSDKGRIVDYVKVAKRTPASLLVVSPNNEETVTHWIDRYCIAEDVRLHCITNDTSMFTLVGPRSRSVASTVLGFDLAFGTNIETRIGQARVIAGFVETPRVQMAHFLVENNDATAIWAQLSHEGEKLGVLRMGFVSYEAFRIARGIPDIGREITSDFNPYEVGLRDAISMTKGCYIGQEVIARLDTYQRVKRKLTGILLTGNCASLSTPVPLLAGGEEVGVMTSCSAAPVNGHHLALGIVRNDRVHEGDSLSVANSSVHGIAITTPILLKTT